jgi:D-alanyl-D-alanine dipeptidase
MEKHGFKYYDKKCWHFAFKYKPYSDTYFDFIVK